MLTAVLKKSLVELVKYLAIDKTVQNYQLQSTVRVCPGEE